MPANFAHRDLRNRSFRGQSLYQADFSGADLRGCNFQGAQLISANFSHAKMGQTRRQRLVWGSVAIAIALLFGNAIARLISASMGQTPEDKAWNYVLVLLAFLASAGAATGSVTLTAPPSPLHRWARWLAGTLSGAIFGFFQIGNATDNNSQAAIAGAVLGGLLMLLGSLSAKSSAAVAIATASTIATYGAAFAIGVIAILFLSVQQFGWGIGFGLGSLCYLWFTLRAIEWLLREIHSAVGTSFGGANLTDAQFDRATLRNTAFTGAIGYPEPSSFP